MLEPLGSEPIGVEQTRRSSKKLFVILALAIGLPIVMTVGILAMVFGGLFFGTTSVEEYKCAMSEIRKNKEAVDFLGEPMKESYFVMPNIEISGSKRDVNFHVAVSGSKSSAILTVNSYRDRFQSNFQMYLEKDGKNIPLYNGVYPCR